MTNDQVPFKKTKQKNLQTMELIMIIDRSWFQMIDYRQVENFSLNSKRRQSFKVKDQLSHIRTEFCVRSRRRQKTTLLAYCERQYHC